MQLTAEQLQAVASGHPLRFYAENTEMVLLRADLYEQARSAVSSDPDVDVRQLYPLVNAIMREDDENDPLLDSYENAASLCQPQPLLKKTNTAWPN